MTCSMFDTAESIHGTGRQQAASKRYQTQESKGYLPGQCSITLDTPGHRSQQRQSDIKQGSMRNNVLATMVYKQLCKYSTCCYYITSAAPKTTWPSLT